MRRTLILSCEHGGNGIPASYGHLFVGQGRLLASHRGWDPGALVIAQRLRRLLHAPLVAAATSRLLVDLNRSSHHRALFSKFTRGLPLAVRQAILAKYYHPHRRAVADLVETANSPVLHVAIHSFTPVLRRQVRRADVGLLYDPSRPHERALARRMSAVIRDRCPDLRLRFNYPYRGAADGLGSAFRQRWSARRYAAMEIEINQRLLERPSLGDLQHALRDALAHVTVAAANLF